MTYDNVCKYLAEEYPEEFARWLLSGNINDEIQVLKTELSLDPIRADSLTFLRTANQILHVEFQTLPKSEPSIPFRMLDYSVRLKRQYRCEVEQVVIFLQRTTNSVVFTQQYRDSTTSHYYRVVRMWEQAPATFMANPALLPLATLTRTDSAQTLLEQVARRVARIESREQRQNILSCADILAGLRYEKALIRQVFREEVMRESVTYQAILKEGRREGIQQGEAAIILRQLTRRIGIVDSSLQERIQRLSITQLEELGEALLDFTTAADLGSWLVDILPPPEAGDS